MNVTSDTPTAAATYRGSTNMAGGSAPSRISRMTPPPTLVTAPSTSAPSTSSSRAAATITPETANAAIPTISSTKISVSISFMGLFRYI